MCGIVGYSGHRAATNVLLDGLSYMEYRGYDSAGITLLRDNSLETIKAKGRLKELIAKCEAQDPQGNCGIGHTRWATHGEPSDVNAHPHYTDRLSLVHNGIIENYMQIKQKLKDLGYEFLTQTDTEVASKLIDYYYEGDPLCAIARALEEFDGSYALAIVFKDFADKVYLARKGSPLVLAKGEHESFAASDISAVLKYTNMYILLEDGDLAVMDKEHIHVYDSSLVPVERKKQKALWTVEEARKNGFDHFMLKEIHEQPKAVSDTIMPRIKNSMPNFDIDNIPSDLFKGINKIHIVACGTAMYAGKIGKSLIESIARVPCDINIASEFRYSNPILNKDDLVIIISQSGETADSLAALRLCKEQGVKVLAVVNVVGSSIAREADYMIKTLAGPEIAVASTKAYSVQISVMYLIAFSLAYNNAIIDEAMLKQYTNTLLGTVDKISEVLNTSDEIKKVALTLKDCEHMFFMGRGTDYALACEGSLKLKEISYIFCEACAAGELKHGHISLVEKDLPIIALMSVKKTELKTLSNIKEVKARGGRVITICQLGTELEEDDTALFIPNCEDIFTVLPAAVVLQLLAYHTAVARECDVDFPRNLAKSVTVE